MRQIEWLNEREFKIGDVRFYCSLDNYSLKTDAERFIILKDREVLGNYAAVFAGSTPKNMLEFGIFQGGSPALFSLWFDVEKFVGVDLCDPVPGFDEFRRKHEAGRRIQAHYGVSQTDQHRIEEIVKSEFGNAPIDIIIDDASHLYKETRRTFEIAFPLLRPGGIYVIEDWGWAHWPNSKFFMGQTALSMLIMELIMLCASRGDLVSEVRVFPAFAFIRKGETPRQSANFELSTLYQKRGIELVGLRDSNLAGLGRILTESIVNRARRKWRRITQRRATSP